MQGQPHGTWERIQLLRVVPCGGEMFSSLGSPKASLPGFPGPGPLSQSLKVCVPQGQGAPCSSDKARAVDTVGCLLTAGQAPHQKGTVGAVLCPSHTLMRLYASFLSPQSFH